MAYDPLSSIGTSATTALAPPPKGPLDDSDSRFKAFSSAVDKETSRHEADVTKERGENERIQKDFFANNPAPVFKPPAPYVPPKDDSPISMWGALAIAFGALASHFTRTPMTTSLNAAGAALTAMKQGKMEEAKASFDQWKAANEQTYKLYEYQRDAYKDLLASVKDQLKNNVDATKEETADYRARITAIASAFKDETSLKMLQENSLEHWTKLQDQRDKNIDQLKENQEKIDQGWQKMQAQVEGAQAEAALKTDPEYQKMVASGDTIGAMQKIAEANPGNTKNNVALQTAQEKKRVDDEKQQQYEDSAKGQAAQQFKDWKASPEGQAASPEDQHKKEAEIYGSFQAKGNRLYPPITPENKTFLASQFASYDLPPPTDAQLGRQPDMLAALEEAKKLNPSYDPAKYQIRKNALNKISNGKDADAIASYVRLDQHLDFFKGLVEKLSDGEDVKTLNGLAALWGKQTGNPNVTSYETALQLVGDEMVKAATGTGAAGALGDREEIKKNFDPSLSKEQLRANINAVQVLVGGALVSTLNKYRNTLTPEELTNAVGSRDVMEHFHVDPDTGKPIVEGAYDFGGKKFQVGADGVTPKEPAAGAPAAGGFTAKWVDKNGKPFGLVGGKYVYADGTPVQ